MRARGHVYRHPSGKETRRQAIVDSEANASRTRHSQQNRQMQARQVGTSAQNKHGAHTGKHTRARVHARACELFDRNALESNTLMEDPPLFGKPHTTKGNVCRSGQAARIADRDRRSGWGMEIVDLKI